MIDNDLNEIERKLHESAEKESNIPLDSFESVYAKIENELENTGAHDKSVAEQSAHFGVRQSGGAVASSRRKIVAVLIAILVVIAVAVPVAVIKLNSATNISGGDSISETDLTEQVTTQSQFEESIAALGIDIIDVSGYDVTEYMLLIYNGSEVKGGSISLNSYNCEAYIRFYGTDVVLDESISADYDLQYSVGYTFITYKNVSSDTYDYGYEALAWDEGIPYRIEYYSDAEDITEFLNNIFD